MSGKFAPRQSQAYSEFREHTREPRLDRTRSMEHFVHIDRHTPCNAHEPKPDLVFCNENLGTMEDTARFLAERSTPEPSLKLHSIGVVLHRIHRSGTQRRRNHYEFSPARSRRKCWAKAWPFPPQRVDNFRVLRTVYIADIEPMSLHLKLARRSVESSCCPTIAGSSNASSEAISDASLENSFCSDCL